MIATAGIPVVETIGSALSPSTWWWARIIGRRPGHVTEMLRGDGAR